MRGRRPGHGDDLRAAELTQSAPYGSWRSPITADLITAGSVRLTDLRLHQGEPWWLELRPAEGGRLVLVRNGTDVTPAGFNVRTRVHEYGGAPYVLHEGRVWFSNFADQRLYRQAPGAAPAPITEAVDRRYADAVVDARRGVLFAVREDHTGGGEAVNTIVRLGFDGSDEQVVVSGNDFYSNPRLSPDGARLCWLTWHHPHMPWDGTELWVGELDGAGNVGRAERVPGADDDSIFQPEWSPGGVLHFVSDRSGWWNLYSWRPGSEPEPLAPAEAEFGVPQWVFGQSTYAFTPEGGIVCTWVGKEGGKLGTLARPEPVSLDTPYTSFAYVRTDGSGVWCIAGSPTEPSSVVRIPLQGGPPQVLRRSLSVDVDPGYFSKPHAVEFETTGGKTAHAFFYPPHNPDFEPTAGERAPLVVHSHGGPTAAFGTTLSLETQYWTSRGIAVVDVNYGGSTGYGSEYRRRLNGQWGVVDVDDCCNAARHLVAEGLADGNRLAIAGGSAGGYTTLACLTFRPDVFDAGANHFGLSDLRVFVHDTHKFESRYLDSLVGPWPEREDLYVERSPITQVDNLSCPLIVFQGDEDKIVPPNQSEIIVDAARRKGLPVAYLLFAGEQHGFRKAENIKRALEGELYFYGQVFDFATADEIPPVEIENL